MAGQGHTDSTVQIDLLQISQKLLLNAKRHETTVLYTDQLAGISERELTRQLSNDNKKKAFWINIYNAYTQILLYGHAEKYKKRNAFFGSKDILIAGRKLSLDFIEHGILRRSSLKWSMGYLRKWFPGSFEKKLRLDTLDYRIHFSLNCGARSCPPIAFYRAGQIDRQLQTATHSYLAGEAEYKSSENCLYLPAIMGWFRGDFGSKKKMIQIMKDLKLLDLNANPGIRFKKYNWQLFLENYKPIPNE